jgi:two-component system LytT family sensor kinase
MAKLKFPAVLLHVCIWVIFMMIPLLFLTNGPGGKVDLLTILSFPKFWIFIVVFLLLFYFNTYFLAPKLYLKKQYLFYGLSILALLAVFSYLQPFHKMVDRERFSPGRENKFPPEMPAGSTELRLKKERPGPGEPEPFHFDITGLFLFIMVVTLGLAIQSVRQWHKTEQRALQAEADKANAEVSFLKAQINPHFLFNTLNSIYALAIMKSDDTATAVVKLSGMMRYLVSESQQDLVPLEKEISYINDYIDLQKMRLGNTVDFSYELEGSFFGKNIAPLILITFVENAFKYGVNPEENSLIRIRLSIEESKLLLMVKNNKVNTTIREIENTGLGIRNTRDRLQFLYPDSHMLQIADNEKDFTVTLNLNLS